MIEQLNALFATMIGKANVGTKSPLVCTGIAVIHHKPDIIADQMPLSAFNVLLSENHEQCWMPVVGFPATSKNTDIRNAITSAIEDFVISESGIDTNLAQALRYITDEIIDNITEHADTAEGYVCAAWDGNTVTVCIADAGKTVYGSYVDGDFYQIYSDQMALQAAVSGLSTKNLPGAENRGYGISTSVDMIVKGMDSALIILSGRGLLFRDVRRNDFTELPEPIFMPGTLVCFSMPVHKLGFSLYNHIGG
ncbi:MAG: hypothetical protein K6F94_02555 [Bacteroidaceae bacterium]|nr:hypothetical protein [Bacteroidaceae bacterium]